MMYTSYSEQYKDIYNYLLDNHYNYYYSVYYEFIYQAISETLKDFKNKNNYTYEDIHNHIKENYI